jgi:hypothetical protein
LSSDIDPCLLEIVAELSSCICERWSLWPPPNIWECLFSVLPVFTSTVLRDDRGRLTVDALGEARCFAPRAVNLNLGSIASRFLDCGGRLFAAYGSFASPAGVKGLLYVGAVVLEGLVSRETGTEVSLPGPIEKAPPCLGGVPDSADRLVGLVVTPEDPGLDSSMFVVDGDVPGGEICGVTAAGSSSASTFCSGAPFAVPSTASRDLVAAGVIGGECIEVGRGL